MKLFVFKLKIPGSRVQRFTRHLLDSARVVGITLSSSTRDSEDPEDSDENQVLSFICQAPASLTPEQITAVMALCQIYKATVLGISYTDVVDIEDEEGRNGAAHFLPAPSPSPLALVVDNTEKEP